VNNLFYQNIALVDTGVGARGVDGRFLYGTQPQRANLRVPTRNTVLDVTNQSRDYAYNLTAGLTRRFQGRFGGSAFYTFTRARDVQNLTSSTAFSQYRFGRQYAGRQDELNLAPSIFETPHRVVATGTYTLPTRTNLSFIYTGQSGQAYTFVSSGDLNGDGVTLNDPVYIPTGPEDPRAPQFVDVRRGTTVVTPAADQEAAFYRFLEGEECLRGQRGRIVGRNSCRAPFTNRLDVALEQQLPSFRGQHLTLRADAINFLNLLNNQWGLVRTVDSPRELYTQTGVTGNDLRTGVPLANFSPTFRRDNPDVLGSNYQFQFSVRYSF